MLSEGSDESSVLLSLPEKAESLPSKPGVVSNGIHPIPRRDSIQPMHAHPLRSEQHAPKHSGAAAVSALI